MEKYSSYMDSGEKWLGEIPGHWEMVRWRHLMNENCVQNTNCKVTNQLQFKYGEIVQKNNQDTDSDVLETISKYTVVEPNDIMINGLNLNYDFISQRIGEVTQQGVITSAYISLRPTGKASHRYLLFLLKAMDSQKLFHGMGAGVRVTLSYKELKNKFLPIPSDEEQQAIVSYLDRVTGDIDREIAESQRMIDLLNERKQIIIQHAVTKGLNPNAKRKYSGVEWIGDVPEGWEVCHFRRLITLLTDYTANGSFGDLAKNIHYQSTGFARLIRLTDLRENVDNENGVWVDKHAYEYLSKSSLHGGELLMANVGAYSGFVCIMPYKQFPCTLAPNMFLLKQDERKVETKFLYNLLLSKPYFNWLQTIAVSSAQPKLNKENIRSLPIVVPPISEQQQIVDHIEKSLEPIFQAIASTERKISLLRERKQIIINEVVTGKVKVS